MAVYTATIVTSIGGTQVSVSSSAYSYAYFLQSMLSRILLLRSIDITDTADRDQLLKVLKFTEWDSNGDGDYTVVAPQLYGDQTNFTTRANLSKPILLDGLNTVDYTIKANQVVQLTFNMDCLDIGQEIENMPDDMKEEYMNPKISKVEELEELFEPEELKEDNEN